MNPPPSPQDKSQPSISIDELLNSAPLGRPISFDGFDDEYEIIRPRFESICSELKEKSLKLQKALIYKNMTSDAESFFFTLIKKVDFVFDASKDLKHLVDQLKRYDVCIRYAIVELPDFKKRIFFFLLPQNGGLIFSFVFKNKEKKTVVYVQYIQDISTYISTFQIPLTQLIWNILQQQLLKKQQNALEAYFEFAKYVSETLGVIPEHFKNCLFIIMYITQLIVCSTKYPLDALYTYVMQVMQDIKS